MATSQQKHWPRLDVLEAIRLRRSIRRYSDLPVEWDKIGTVVDAGRVAPSAGNIQSWRFIVVESHPKRKALAEACLRQYWMEEAPVHILIVMLLKKVREFYGKRADFYAVQESAMAAQNMLLAAQVVGLGSCFVSAFDDEKVSEIFSLPADVRPMGIVTLGYPNESPEEPLKYRIENVTFIDRWGQQNIGRIRDVDAVIWNFRVVERGIQIGNDFVKAVDLHTRDGRRKIVEKLKEKTSAIRERLEGKKRKQQP
ncbi:nitroreductase family protein [Candidatus Woesearchaeota archaeon]|nr:nitroreductase family protein [Candidatus Woesearchaeota archaeon]